MSAQEHAEITMSMSDVAKSYGHAARRTWDLGFRTKRPEMPNLFSLSSIVYSKPTHTSMEQLLNNLDLIWTSIAAIMRQGLHSAILVISSIHSAYIVTYSKS